MNNNITGGVIWKQLLLFFFPIWFGTFFQQLYNTADAVIVGNFVGKGALAAVGTTAVVQNLLVGFFVGVASGASVVISQYYGARQGAQVVRGTDEGGHGDDAGVHEELRHLGDAAYVLAPVVGREAQVVVDARADVVAVQHAAEVAAAVELALQGDGQGALA